MNNFERAPETLFSGSMKWFGIQNDKMGVFHQLSEAERHSVMGRWPSVINEQSPRGSVFSAHLLRMIVSCDSTALDEITLERDAVKFRFACNRFDEWLPAGEIENSWLGDGYGSVGNWSLIGVAEHIVVSAFARQFWQPALTYGEGKLGPVSMHIRPVTRQFAEKIAGAVQ